MNRTKLVVSNENDSNSNSSNNNKENLNDKQEKSLSNLMKQDDSVNGYSENSLDENSTTNDKMDTSTLSTSQTNGVSNSVLNGDNSQDAQDAFPDTTNNKKGETSKK